MTSAEKWSKKELSLDHAFFSPGLELVSHQGWPMSQDSSCVFSLEHCDHAGCREVTCISSVIFPVTCLVYRTHCTCFSVFPVILLASVVSTAFLLWSVLLRESEHSALCCPEESFHSCCSCIHPFQSPPGLSLCPSLDYWCAPRTSPPTLNSLVLPSVNFSHSLQNGHFLLLAQKPAWVLLGRTGLMGEHLPQPQH